MAITDTPILQLKNVSKRYANGVQALTNVSFDVLPGEFVVMIGKSGSGKSTTLRCINRLIPVTSGEVIVDNQNVCTLRSSQLREVRRKIGMVFQHYNLVERLTVLQNVMHGRLGYMGTLQGMMGQYPESEKEKAIQLLNDIGLGSFLYNRAGELSGGQRQRVGVARAFMQEPVIMLCDEPIASLDPSSAKLIMDSIRNFALSQGIACIVNLHQVDVALEYATRIIGLRGGEILYDGPPAQISNHIIEEIYETPFDQLMIRSEEVPA